MKLFKMQKQTIKKGKQQHKEIKTDDEVQELSSTRIRKKKEDTPTILTSPKKDYTTSWEEEL